MKRRLHDETPSPQDTAEQYSRSQKQCNFAESRTEDNSLFQDRKQPNHIQRPRSGKPHADTGAPPPMQTLVEWIGHVFTVATDRSLNSPHFRNTDVHTFYF
ncbi:hypothetical protein QQF64_026853 [Cirrhinus molitorella]|uniref:Uncharacterized protein n=1 Tax=Cirrhinus molitorella TaxID=172907 RepID=A0ABR3NAR3_9TELE